MHSFRTVSVAVATLLVCGCALQPAEGGRPASGAPEAVDVVVVVASSQARLPAESVVAIRADGAELPMREEKGRGRLWLTGTLPPGEYTGLAIRAPESTRLAGSFQVPARGAVVLMAKTGGRSEATVAPADKIASGVMGLASVPAWDAVAVFDKRSGDLAALLPAGRSPSGIAIDVERSRAYVAARRDDTIASLDLLEGRLRETIPLRAGDSPVDLALTPDGGTLLVANSGSDTVSFVDPLATIETTRLEIGSRPTSIVVDDAGRRAYVVTERAGGVAVVDVASRTVVGTIATESGPRIARLGGRNGGTLYVAHDASPYLTVADTTTFATTGRVYVGPRARALAVDPRSGRIFLARAGTGTIEEFDPTSLLPVERIPVPGEVRWLSIEREGNGLGIAIADPPEIRVVRIVGRETASRTELGAPPAAVRFVEAR